MKIDPHYCLPILPKPTTLAPSDCFARLICTANQVISGDEFYWQHQTQLQQSALDFSQVNHAKYTVIKPALPIITPEPPAKILSPTSLAALDEPSKPLASNPMATLKSENSSHAASTIVLIKQKIPAVISMPLPAVAARKINTTLAHESYYSSTHTVLHLSKIKKHHLYVAHAEAELTMNLEKSDLKEQQYLLDMIKNTLKNKGISLKNLIINGVTHD